MGLFDGLKDAFVAPALENSSIDAERETPIDRWMGWNQKDGQLPGSVKGAAVPANFVDSMDNANYVSIMLEKPMGILFEENDNEYGGIFVLSLTEGGIAETSGLVNVGDQLVAVGDKKVYGQSFDESLNAIIESTAAKTTLLVFRGPVKDLYGPTGASQAWLDEFISGSAAQA